MSKRVRSYFGDDSGLILRGNAAVIGLVIFGVVALFSGPVGWAAFAVTLLASAVLTGLNMAVRSFARRGERSRAANSIQVQTSSRPDTQSAPGPVLSPLGLPATEPGIGYSPVGVVVRPREIEDPTGRRFPKALVDANESWLASKDDASLLVFIRLLRAKWDILPLGVSVPEIVPALALRFPEAMSRPLVLETVASLIRVGGTDSAVS